ncbi:MAG TPA: hypothetical protein VJR22_03395 [Candidatus Nitrosotalea sp.]|nr:hypothetical protein [Nitrososphaerota archaeon]HKU32873.1 hypothetical protein [Candidatus Nitrosotalea sp.]
MNKTITSLTIALLLVPVLAVGGFVEYNAHSSSYNPSTGGTSNVDYQHHHCTIGLPCYTVCGDHICKPGEKPPSAH